MTKSKTCWKPPPKKCSNVARPVWPNLGSHKSPNIHNCYYVCQISKKTLNIPNHPHVFRYILKHPEQKQMWKTKKLLSKKRFTFCLQLSPHKTNFPPYLFFVCMFCNVHVTCTWRARDVHDVSSGFVEYWYKSMQRTSPSKIHLYSLDFNANIYKYIRLIDRMVEIVNISWKFFIQTLRHPSSSSRWM